MEYKPKRLITIGQKVERFCIYASIEYLYLSRELSEKRIAEF